MNTDRQPPLRITLVLCLVLPEHYGLQPDPRGTAPAWWAPLTTFARRPGAWTWPSLGDFFRLGILYPVGFLAPGRVDRTGPASVRMDLRVVGVDRPTDFPGSVPRRLAIRAVLTAILLGWTTAVALDKRNQAYFGKEANERKLENHPSA